MKALALKAGEIWLVSIGGKGTVCAVGKPMSDGKWIPSYTCLGEPTRDLPAVAIGKGVSAPWSGRKNPYAASFAAFGAYTGERSEKGFIIPLSDALASGAIVPLTVYRDGKPYEVYVSKKWKAGTLLPLLLGTKENGAYGRIEPRAHPDKARRATGVYSSYTFRVSLTPPQEPAKATAKPTVKTVKASTVKPTIRKRKLAKVVESAQAEVQPAVEAAS